MFIFGKRNALNIPQITHDEVIQHAKEEYPNECCGVLVGNPIIKRVFTSYRVANLNKERSKDRYIIDPREINLIDRQARAESLDIIGFYHSHPDHPDKPSEYDREVGHAGYSYVIISVNKGKDISMKSWSFKDEGDPFKEEGIKIVT
ncbi:MAG: M67 family metallopeptidase [Deltaproteobacteria bacterium]|nr:M67 family metallopeptidase [Deltaproteobacteria bacterium]